MEYTQNPSEMGDGLGIGRQHTIQLPAKTISKTTQLHITNNTPTTNRTRISYAIISQKHDLVSLYGATETKHDTTNFCFFIYVLNNITNQRGLESKGHSYISQLM